MSALFDRIRNALASTHIVEEEIAHGGMSVVFRGRDVALDRVVAIKVIKPEIATARIVERFTQEARLLANLNNRHIVPVYSAGEADGLFYYVMPLVNGETLAERMKRGRVSPPEAMRIARDVLDALATAHRIGITHRDVTARNIFVVGNDALLADFGLASASGVMEAGVSGTIGSMPPEQSLGSDVSPAADVYALAVLMYQVVTGRPWTMSATADKTVWRGVPGPLARVLRRALAWAPADRYPDAMAFAGALRRAQRQPLIAAAIVATIAFAAAAATVLRSPPSPAAKGESDLAILPFDAPDSNARSLGHDVALLTALRLEGVPDFRITPTRYAFPWWDAMQARSAPPDFSRLGSKYYVTGTVVRHGADVSVTINVHNADGRDVTTMSVTGSASSPDALSDSIALELLRRVHPQFASAFKSATPVTTRDIDALREFLLGEQAFHRGAWLPADQHYRAAVAQDSTFLLASWRLLNVWRWMPTVVPDPRLDLAGMYKAHGASLPELDRRLIEAQISTTGQARIAGLEQAARSFPRDGYAQLLLADEMFHRGPLIGIPLSRALAALEQSAALDEFLAPTQEHIAWAAIRLGDRATAQRALDRLVRLEASPGDVDVYIPPFYQQGFIARFDSAHALGQQQAFFDSRTAQGLGALRFGTRAGLALALPLTQRTLARWLIDASDATRADRANGHEALGLAFISEGNAASGLVHIDSAAALFDTPAAHVESAEWRVFGTLMGWPIVAVSPIPASKTTLLRYASDSRVRARALFVLSIAYLEEGDTIAAARMIARMKPDPAAQRLTQLVTAIAAARHDTRNALAISDGLIGKDSHGALGDPFARAVLHLYRARWRTAIGDDEGAAAELMWAENQDFVGWPGGSAQSMEVDWTASAYGLTQRAALAEKHADHAAACALLREAALWTHASSGSCRL